MPLVEEAVTSNHPLYVLPVPPRAGLGNMLLPWARGEIFARRHDAKMLAPFWPPFRVGPYLRKEPDKRNYAGLFRAPHHIHGLRKRWILSWSKMASESDPEIGHRSKPTVMLFKGLGDGTGCYFKPLQSERDFVRGVLWNMTAPELRDAGRQYGGRYIAVHVRRGDVTRAGLSANDLDNFPLYTPIEWFTQTVTRLRRQLPAIPVVLFTDGSEEEVRPLMTLGNVHLKPRQSAITDLWALSHARLLIATGHSTFSMWASYLGGMPTIYAPGKMQEKVQDERAGAMEIELAAGDEVPSGLLAGL